MGAYQRARRELVRTRDEAAAAAEEFLDAEKALRDCLEREGSLAIGASVYSVGPDGRLRWRARPVQPLGWRHYISP